MLIPYIKDYCEKNNIDPSEALSQVVGMISNEEGGISLDSVFSLLGSLGGGTGGSSYITEIENEKATVDAYYLAKYQDEITQICNDYLDQSMAKYKTEEPTEKPAEEPAEEATEEPAEEAAKEGN